MLKYEDCMTLVSYDNNLVSPGAAVCKDAGSFSDLDNTYYGCRLIHTVARLVRYPSCEYVMSAAPTRGYLVHAGKEHPLACHTISV